MNPVETIQASCPYCGEVIDISVDISQSDQEYIEDCSVCCRPIVISVSLDSGDTPILNLRRDDE
jgi:hypothetical protein